ncbi:MAG: hypothetical protein BGO97_11065 [Micrococcales bacterium 70-64]|nr:DoxX family protein [Leifsonia sp.]ODU64517.1 MAG: hypothetical protein ABT06_11070 [Leifsonia sp. SCN 70-46]OJX86209.1 MAG: hypothetical protein BGO97_11065 [Micrococcales bacterium 70-64]
MGGMDTAQWVIRIALAVMFFGMGVSHFVPSVARGMSAMIPEALKRRVSGKALVRFTGVCEIAGAVGILVPATRFAAGIALVLFLIAVFPANAHAADNPERFGRAAFPFWPRYLAQVALILVVLLAVV